MVTSTAILSCEGIADISSPKQIRLTLLGTGSSGGVPRIGNQWGACNPGNPRNRRRRCACLFERVKNPGTNDEKITTVLVDTGPDLREQLLAANVTDIQGVLLTHGHADHIAGIDDLRQLWVTHRRRMDVYMDDLTTKRMLHAFSYIFEQPEGSSYPPFCNALPMAAGELVRINGEGGCLEAMPLQVEHGDIHALGFRVGDIAYVPDVKTVAIEDSLERLQALDVLVLDSLRRSPHPTHMNLDEALEFISAVQPQRAILTNMHSDLDYQQLSAELPDNVVPGFDGLIIESPIAELQGR